MKKDLALARFLILLATGLCVAGIAPAQDQPPPAPQGEEKPKPAARAYGPIGADDQDATQTPADTLQPDDRPLTGFQQPTIGTPTERHSYWVPGVSYYNFIQSNGQTAGGGSSWNSTNYLAGNLSLLKNWSTSQLALNYSGGGNFSTDSSVGNGWFQQLGASQTFNWRRWQLTVLDEFAYLPQSQFGFGAGTGLALPGIGGSLGLGTTGLGGGLDPGQSVFSAIGPRYTNVFGVQMNYMLTPRSSITFGGIDSILRFSDPGNIESNDYVGNLGYNYQITREDTLGIVYRYSSYHYLGFPQTIADQTVQAAYGRKITGRLALQFTGGPEITNFRVAQTAGGTKQFVAGTGSATVTYALEGGSIISASYFHGLTAGSGVFLGATTDQLRLSGSRKLTRQWTGNANLGYARNRSVANVQITNNVNFDTVYGGVSAARQLGHNAYVSLGYTVYVERPSNTVCAGTNCASDFTTHQISLGVSWHTRPFVLR